MQSSSSPFPCVTVSVCVWVHAAIPEFVMVRDSVKLFLEACWAFIRSPAGGYFLAWV